MFRKSNLPELLSPAGSFEALIAAVGAGADAVYFGGKQLNARAFARNFDDEEIARAVVYCHLHGAKAYVTLNTLLSERELESAVKRAGELRELGVDALIVADVGLISRINELYPDLPIHASTQASAHSTEGCDLLAGLGAGIYSSPEEATRGWQKDLEFTPRMDEATRLLNLKGWHKAVEKSLGWAKD